jgi:peptidoglycan/xylan/chitin deacetylase (PgdA/CDA1 family)
MTDFDESERWGWPGGARAAVSLTFDVDAEAGYLGEGQEYLGRLSALSEGRYGVRRGVPRLLALLAERDMAASFFVPGDTAERHAGLVESLLAAGHEIGHHGYLHLRSDHVDAAAQREEIERGFAALEAAGAPRPRGYRSTSWELTPETFGLLLEAGFAYDSSCMGDDRPYYEQYGGARILELPVHWSLDDWPRFGWLIDGGGNMTAPAELASSWIVEYESARAEGRHVTFTMHPEVIGRPQRLVALVELLDRIAADDDVWVAPLADVADHAARVLAREEAAA